MHGSLLQLYVIMIDQISIIQHSGRFSKGSDVYAALDKSERLAASYFSSGDLYIAGGTFEEAFWRTMVGNLVHTASGYRPITEHDYELYRAFRCARRPWSPKDVFHDVASTAEQSLFDRSFFLTTQGYIGTGPPTARVGDDICAVMGSNVPFMLRSRNESIVCNDSQFSELDIPLYSFVGDSYVHGLMNGEVMYETEREITPILLC
jgi:hypothetical protein